MACAGHRISTAELIEVTAAAISVQTAPSPGRGAAQSRKKIAETELNISLRFVRFPLNKKRMNAAVQANFVRHGKSLGNFGALVLSHLRFRSNLMTGS